MNTLLRVVNMQVFYNTYLKIYCSKNVDLLKYYIQKAKYLMLKNK